jgi:GDP-4-dehydro-6-deoxy-D-mannose reductase
LKIAARRRIVVTGAAGFVGRHLLDLLEAEEPAADLHAWHRPSRSGGTAPEVTGARVTSRAVEALDRAAVRQALAETRPDEVYHLVGAPHVAESWTDPAGALDSNVVATHLLLDEIRRLHLGTRVLLPGSATVYAPGASALSEESPLAPASPYALSKMAQEMVGERAVGEDRQEVLLARAFNHIGPGQDPSFFASGFARQIARIELGRVPPVLRVGNLDARRDLTDVRDMVRAYHALMARGGPGRPYNVCSGQAWSIGQVLTLLMERCRVPITVERDTSRLRPSDAPVVLGSFARLHAETGWTPSIPLDQTLKDLLDQARAREGAEGGSAPAQRGRPTIEGPPAGKRGQLP